MNKCKNCAYLFTKPKLNPICALNRHSVNPEGQRCQCFIDKTNINHCDICGEEIINYTIYQTDSIQKYICSSCASASGTCNLCKQCSQCEFETNSSPLPKKVIKQIQRGPAIMQTEVMNPDRIKETCMKGCPCWDEKEQYCLKENRNRTCGRYELCFGS